MIDGINQLPAQTYFYQKDIKLGRQMYFFFTSPKYWQYNV